MDDAVPLALLTFLSLVALGWCLARTRRVVSGRLNATLAFCLYQISLTSILKVHVRQPNLWGGVTQFGLAIGGLSRPYRLKAAWLHMILTGPANILADHMFWHLQRRTEKHQRWSA